MEITPDQVNRHYKDCLCAVAYCEIFWSCQDFPVGPHHREVPDQEIPMLKEYFRWIKSLYPNHPSSLNLGMVEEQLDHSRFRTYLAGKLGLI